MKDGWEDRIEHGHGDDIDGWTDRMNNDDWPNVIDSEFTGP